MAIGWYIVPYVQHPEILRRRYCQIDDYSPQIYAAGGHWMETEILGNRALVKLRAPVNIQNNAKNNYKKMPVENLDVPLTNLPTAQKQALRAELLDMGYTEEDVYARFGDDLSIYTLREVFTFMAQKRKEERYDEETQTHYFDGPDVSCKPIEEIDEGVQE